VQAANTRTSITIKFFFIEL